MPASDTSYPSSTVTLPRARELDERLEADGRRDRDRVGVVVVHEVEQRLRGLLFGARAAAQESDESRDAAGLGDQDLVVAALHAAVDVTLEKPLGLVLEENTPDGADGLYVADIMDSGSACKNADVRVSLQLQSVDGVDVTALGFDDAMELIGDAGASPVRLTFEGDGAPEESSFLDDEAPADDGAASSSADDDGRRAR
ncbi:hypothetical protein SO694_00083127 [Aureococcus anophagefferens]|uniref:PDZ domain-containing protein n=1 Tax=Aureococcus anophagefferens TaxID=44056 RepID=A0ABR1FJC1_AURAN